MLRNGPQGRGQQLSRSPELRLGLPASAPPRSDTSHAHRSQRTAIPAGGGPVPRMPRVTPLVVTTPAATVGASPQRLSHLGAGLGGRCLPQGDLTHILSAGLRALRAWRLFSECQGFSGRQE